MDLKKITGSLTASEKEALKILEASGWEMLFSAMIEDCYLKDGNRRPTFKREGRHNIVMSCRNVDDSDRIAAAAKVEERLKSKTDPTQEETKQQLADALEAKRVAEEARIEADAKLAAVEKELKEAVAAAKTETKPNTKDSKKKK